VERYRLIRKLTADLDRFRRIPAHQREAKVADEGARTCFALLRELNADVDDCGRH
jgi:hypothetical protein